MIEAPDAAAPFEAVRRELEAREKEHAALRRRKAGAPKQESPFAQSHRSRKQEV